MATLHGMGHVDSRQTAVPAGRRGASAQLTAVLDALLDVRPRRTALDIEEFAFVDDLLFARAAGEADFRHYLGPRAALVEALDWLTASRAMSSRERAYLLQQLAKVPDVAVASTLDEDV